jgi:hypothetical protein
MYRAGLVIAAVLTSLPGQAAEADVAKIDQLVRQLGSEKFREREAASKQLEEIGEPALEGLAKARASSDPEVSRRATELTRVITVRAYGSAINTIKRMGGTINPDGHTIRSSDLQVDLSRTAISDEDLPQLAGLRGLCFLHLNSTHVTDLGVGHLRRLKRLVWLDLSGTMLTDQGLPSLKGLAKLKYLVIGGTAVTNRGIADLQKALPALKILR